MEPECKVRRGINIGITLQITSRTQLYPHSQTKTGLVTVPDTASDGKEGNQHQITLQITNRLTVPKPLEAEILQYRQYRQYRNTMLCTEKLEISGDSENPPDHPVHWAGPAIMAHTYPSICGACMLPHHL